MQTKVCKVCDKEMELDHFRLVGKYYRNTCKACECARDKQLQQQLRDYVTSFKDKCAKCGDTRNYLLDFHHKESEEKELCISAFCSTRKWSENSKKVVDDEVSKCIVLCANCHREFHFLERNEGYINLEKYLQE